MILSISYTFILVVPEICPHVLELTFASEAPILPMICSCQIRNQKASKLPKDHDFYRG